MVLASRCINPQKLCQMLKTVAGRGLTQLGSWRHDRINAAAEIAERDAVYCHNATKAVPGAQARQREIEAKIHAGKPHMKTISPSSSPACPQLWEARVIARLLLTHASLWTGINGGGDCHPPA